MTDGVRVTGAEFETWSAWAVEIREKAVAGEVEFEEYQRAVKE